MFNLNIFTQDDKFIGDKLMEDVNLDAPVKKMAVFILLLLISSIDISPQPKAKITNPTSNLLFICLKIRTKHNRLPL